MGQLFSDLSYNNKYAMPVGRPIDDLQALYKKKEEDYLTATDNFYNMKTALKNIPAHERDAGIVANATKVYEDAFTKAEEAGNFEDMIPDTKKLANALANDYGLNVVQKNALKKQQGFESLKERLDAGEITRQQYQEAVTKSERDYTGVYKDEKTGEYVGDYNVTQVQNYVNASQEIVDLLKGVQANTVDLFDPETGAKLYYDKGTGKYGYLTHGTMEYVDETRLVQIAKAHITSSPEIQSQFAEDLMFEKDNLLWDEDTRTRRELTSMDVRNAILRGGNTEQFLKQLGITNINDTAKLEEIAKNRGLDLSDLYDIIRNDQKSNRAMIAGVGKEAYVKYERKYLKDWKAELDYENNFITGGGVDFGIMRTVHSPTTLTTEDTERVSQNYKETTNLLQTQQNKLRELEEKAKTGEVDPDAIDRAKKDIAISQAKISSMEKRINEVVTQTPKITQAVKDLVANSFDTNEYFKEMGIYNYENRYIDNLGIEGLSINEGSVERLLYTMLGNEITDEELQEYIQLDKNNIMANAIAEFSSYANTHTSELPNIIEAVKKGGEQVLEELLPNARTLVSKVKQKYNDTLRTSTNNFRNKLNNIVKQYKETTEDEGFAYTTDYKVFSLPDLSPKEARANPVHQLHNYTQNIVDISPSKFYMNLHSPETGQPIADAVEDAAKDYGDISNADGDIKWDKATMIPGISTMRDINTGKYAPVMYMTVPVQTGKKASETQLIEVVVSNPEESYVAKSRETLLAYRNSVLKRKQAQGDLKPTDKLLLGELNKSLYNLSGYGDDLDNLDLNAMDNGEVVRGFDFWNDHTTNIKAYKYGSPDNKAFYLTSDLTDDSGAVIKDDNGKPLQGFHAVDSKGNTSIVSEEELRGSKWTALGSNTPEGLKGLLSNVVGDFLGGAQGYRVPLDETVNVASLFGSNIKQGVVPLVTKKAAESLQKVTQQIPNLYVTDGIRKNTVGYGASNSEHKYANAIDFRINEASNQLVNLSQEELTTLGIKSAKIHDKGTANAHVHVEFLK